jgi:hypothetical protein
MRLHLLHYAHADRRRDSLPCPEGLSRRNTAVAQHTPVSTTSTAATA